MSVDVSSIDPDNIAGSNNCPTQCQLEDAQARLAEVASDLATLDSQRKTLKASAYRSERSLQQKRAEVYRKILAPIRQIPIEVYPIIFTFCHTSGRMMQRSDRKWPYPLVLSQVCRGWRAIIAQTPQLWSKYNFWFTEPVRKGAQNIREMQVTRSVSCSTLEVTMYFENMTEKYSSSTIWNSPSGLNTPLSKFISPNSQRITVLDLQSLPIQILSQLFHLKAGSFPVLESLYLDYDSNHYWRTFRGWQIVKNVPAFKNSPCLRSFKGRRLGTSAPFNIPSLCLPWSQLSAMDIHVPERRGVGYPILPHVPPKVDPGLTDTIKLCLNLQELSIRSGYGFDFSGLEYTSFSLEKLHTLAVLADAPASDADQNWAQLMVPALTSLTFAHMEYPTIYSFIETSSCRLTTLSIQHDVAAPLDYILSLLELTPTLTTLILIRSITLTADFFIALASRKGNSGEHVYVPHLKILNVECMRAGPVRAADQAVVKMVLSRQLKRLCLHENGKIKGQHRAQLKKCEEDGLDLELSQWF